MKSRDAFIEQAKEKLDRWNGELDELQGKAQEAGAETKAELEKQVALLRQKREQVNDRFTKLRAASEEAWDDLKEGFDEAMDSLKEAIASAKRRFS